MALAIDPHLPDRMGPGDDVSYLIGARIKRIGTADCNGDEVFAIEYQASDGRDGLTLFLFSELGLCKLPEKVRR
jgi:hypothetical protein